MRANLVRGLMADGKVAIGTMISDVRSPAVAQIMAGAGLDFIMLDMEHGAYDISQVADIIKVTRLSGLTPMVRVPDCQYHLIARVLDAGAQAVMVPRIETVEQVKLAADAMRYPPFGKRGASVGKGHNEYLSAPLKEFIEHSNREVMLILQIERTLAVKHIDDLLSVPGVDAALVGPNDLSISLGIPGELQNPMIQNAIQTVVDTCTRHGVISGLHVGGTKVLRHWMSRGMKLIMCSSDVHMLRDGAREIVRELRN